eukprot:scaffold8005_cov391-Pinguiococcus_pyrenoidosus.AAC.5
MQKLGKSLWKASRMTFSHFKSVSVTWSCISNRCTTQDRFLCCSHHVAKVQLLLLDFRAHVLTHQLASRARCPLCCGQDRQRLGGLQGGARAVQPPARCALEQHCQADHAKRFEHS